MNGTPRHLSGAHICWYGTIFGIFSSFLIQPRKYLYVSRGCPVVCCGLIRWQILLCVCTVNTAFSRAKDSVIGTSNTDDLLWNEPGQGPGEHWWENNISTKIAFFPPSPSLIPYSFPGSCFDGSFCLSNSNSVSLDSRYSASAAKIGTGAMGKHKG